MHMTNTTAPANAASPRQIGFVTSLLNDLRDAGVHNDITRAATLAVQEGTMTKRAASRFIDRLRPMAPAPAASDRQREFIDSLVAERPTDHPTVAVVVARLAVTDVPLTKAEASVMITELKAVRDRRPVEVVAADELPADAIDLRDLAQYGSRGSVKFAVPGMDTQLKVKITFRRNGNIYVDDAAVYGRGNSYGSQRTGQGYRGGIEAELRAIIADPAAAALKYSQITGRCAVCSKALEDDKRTGPDGLTSVQRGIGPVCARRFVGLI